MIGSLKALARAGAYLGGALTGLHRRRNADTLTAISFHRVLPPGAPDAAAAMPAFTVDTRVFRKLLAFVDRYYTVVSMADVLAACRGASELPRFAATITFDDGWADNALHAAPILRRMGLPATLFLATGILEGEDAFWREHLHAMSVLLPERRFQGIWRNHLGPCPEGPLVDEVGRYRLVVWAEAADPEVRSSLMEELRAASGLPPGSGLMTEDQVRSWGKDFELGAHGHRHEPLTEVEDARAELRAARRGLRRTTPEAPQGWPYAVSAPHGRYDAAVVESARQEGYELFFTSDVCLNRVRGGRPESDVLGRVFGTTRWNTWKGRFSGTQSANFFFRSPRGALDGRGPGSYAESESPDR